MKRNILFVVSAILVLIAVSLILAGLIGCTVPAAPARVSVGIIGGPDGGSGSQSEDQAPVAYDSNISMTVRYDYDDLIRLGVAVPAFVEIENAGPPVEGTLRLSITPDYSDEAVVYEMPAYVEQGAKAAFTLPFRCDESTQNIKVHLLRNNEVIAVAASARSRILTSEKMLVGVLSDNPEGMPYRSLLSSILDDDSTLVATSSVELTAETFPEQPYMLDRFALILLNHYNLGHLNEGQRTALIRWVRGGGRLLVDADANNAPAVESLKDLVELQVAGAPDDADFIAQFAALAGREYSEELTLSYPGKTTPAGKLAAGSAEVPLIAEYTVESGKVFVTAFALDDPVFREIDAAAVLRKIRGLSAWSADQLQMSQNSYYYRGGNSTLTDAVRSIEWLDAPSIVGILLTLLVFIVLAAPVSYIILSKKDRRDWIWFTSLILAIVCCGVIIGYGVRQHGSQTVSSIVTVIDSPGGVFSADSYSIVGIAAPRQGSYEVTFEEDAFPYKITDSNYNYGYNGNDSDDPPAGKPSIRFDVSGYPKITFDKIRQWDLDTFYLQRDIVLEGALQTRIQYLADGVRYTVRNNTGVPLEDVTVISTLGYERIPLLEIGEEKSGLMQAYAYQQSQQGGAVPPSYYGYGMDHWNIVNELYNNGVADPYAAEQPQDNRSEAEKREDYLRFCIVSNLLETRSQSMASKASFSYPDSSTVWAWSRELGDLSVTANGKETRNDLNRAIVTGTVDVDYESDGEIAIPLGQINGTIIDSSNVVNGSVVLGDRAAYLADGEVTFAFTLPEIAMKYDIDRILVSASYVYGSYTSFLYNNRTGEWDEFFFDTEIEGGAAGDYINGDGTALMKITSDAVGEDSDMNGDMISIDYPTISVSGKEKAHAGN